MGRTVSGNRERDGGLVLVACAAAPMVVLVRSGSRWLVYPNVVGRNLFSFGHDATLARVAGQQQHHFGQSEARAALYQSQPGELVLVAANNEVQNLDVQFECILLINHHSSKHHHQFIIKVLKL